MNRTLVNRRTILLSALLSTFVMAIASLFMPQRESVVFDPSKDTDSICSAEKPYSADAALGEPAHRFIAEVPPEDPLPGKADARVHAVAKNDVIQVEVSTARAGGVAVHGILETHRLRVSGQVSVKLRAKYTGRFPLHFHGDDGSHFEIAVFEVR